MAQVINSNTISLNAQRNLNRSQSQLGVSLQRLSSGMRINSAKDDAAGLAISERMTSQIRGMSQSARNINDAISMVQTSEAALGEMGNLFQRGRELAVQANNSTNSATDRAALQSEVTQLIAEVDRISSATQFNSIKMFDGGSRTATYDATTGQSGLTSAQQNLITSLKTSWLEQGESMIEQYFGIKGDGAGLNIEFVQGEGYLAAISFSGYEVSSGKAVSLTLKIDLDDFLPSDGVNGGSGFVSNDRVIMHELTHAVMARSINLRDAPLWFIEGSAEFIHGADTRLNSDLAAMAGATNADKVANLMNGYLTNDGTSQQYSAGYLATRYLHQDIIDAGGTGIDELFNYLEANNGSTLDTAIQAMKTAHSGLAFSNLAELEGLFDSGDAGNTYAVNLITSGSLTNNDTGAVGGNDADGGSRDTTANGVVPDTLSFNSDPLTYFAETFPSAAGGAILLSATDSMVFQVGANVGETITIDRVAMNAGNLGVENANLTDDAELAILQFDSALSAVNQQRARLGAIQNRLDSASNALGNSIENVSASRSRIKDTDFAVETATLVKAQILQQAGMSIMAQANSLPQQVLSLLQ